MGIAMKLFTLLLHSVYFEGMHARNRYRARGLSNIQAPRPGFPGELVSSIAADALAPCVAKSSAVMVLTM